MTDNGGFEGFCLQNQSFKLCITQVISLWVDCMLLSLFIFTEAFCTDQGIVTRRSNSDGTLN